MPKDLNKIIKEKINYLDAIPDEFIDQTVRGASAPLYDIIISDFVDLLDVKDGKILATASNIRLVATIDKVWSSFQAKNGLDLVETHLSNFETIVQNNTAYYAEILADNKSFIQTAQNITDIVNRRLGINPDGSLIKGGYLGGILEDVSVRNELKEFAVRGVANAQGYQDFKQQFSDLIKGSDGKLGVLQKYYRNIAYDSYKQIDGLNNKMFGQEFDLKYFVYDGTIIKTTRAFCRKRVGLLFTVEQAQEWKDDPELTAAPLNYDPLADMGGYGCRHTPRFLTDDMAYDLEPSLKQGN